MVDMMIAGCALFAAVSVYLQLIGGVVFALGVGVFFWMVPQNDNAKTAPRKDPKVSLRQATFRTKQQTMHSIFNDIKMTGKNDVSKELLFHALKKDARIAALLQLKCDEPSDELEIENVFMAMDVDNDGRITYHELSKFVRLQDAKHKTTSLAIQIFNKIDSSGNGSVDRYEFDNAMRSNPELKRYMNLLEENIQENIQNNATTTTTTPRQTTTTTTTTSTPASIGAQVVVADEGLLSATNFAVIPDGHAVATGGNASNQYAVDTTEGSGTFSIFDKIDVNHDSEISWIEFDQYVSTNKKNAIKNIFETMDKDVLQKGDNTVNAGEFLAALKKDVYAQAWLNINSNASSRSILAVFHAMDMDNNNTIDLDEALDWFC